MDFEAAKALCRSFPGVTEDIKWGEDLVFSVGEKMFAVTGNAAPAQAMSFKAEDERFLELTDRPGIIPAPTWRARNGCGWMPAPTSATKKRPSCCAVPTNSCLQS